MGPLESFIFDRTEQEKGRTPGRQIPLMKFVRDHRVISLLIKVGTDHRHY